MLNLKCHFLLRFQFSSVDLASACVLIEEQYSKKKLIFNQKLEDITDSSKKATNDNVICKPASSEMMLKKSTSKEVSKNVEFEDSSDEEPLHEVILKNSTFVKIFGVNKTSQNMVSCSKIV